jgi:hypothetical protein
MYAKQFESDLCTYIYKINIYMFGIAKYLDTEESPAGEAQAFLCKDDLLHSRAFGKPDVYQCSEF